jgi:hypothetical protein
MVELGGRGHRAAVRGVVSDREPVDGQHPKRGWRAAADPPDPGPLPVPAPGHQNRDEQRKGEPQQAGNDTARAGRQPVQRRLRERDTGESMSDSRSGRAASVPPAAEPQQHERDDEAPDD